MDNQTNLLQQRWAMLTNPFSLRVRPMCKLTNEEIFEHLKLIDLLPGRRFSAKNIKRCCYRFAKTFGED